MLPQPKLAVDLTHNRATASQSEVHSEGIQLFMKHQDKV